MINSILTLEQDFNINKNEFRIKIEKNGFISTEIPSKKKYK